MDPVLKLRELRRRAQLSQKEVAARSGIGEKTLSSYETGARIGSLKLTQLERLLAVYGLSLATFFSEAFEATLAGDPPPILEQLRLLVEPLTPHAQEALLASVKALVAPLPRTAPPRPVAPPHAPERRPHGPHPAAPARAAR